MLQKKSNIAVTSESLGILLEEVKDIYNVKSAERIFSKASKLANSEELEKLVLESQVNFYSKVREFKKLEEFCTKLIEIYTTQKDISNLAKCYLKLGIAYRSYGNYEQSLDFYRKALLSYRKIHDDRGVAKMFINYGNLYKDKGEFNHALENYLKAKEIIEKLENDDLKFLVNQNLAQIYFLLNYDKKAHDLFQKDLDFFIKEKMFSRAATSLSGIAEIQLKNSKPFRAKKTIKNAIHYWIKLEDKKGLGEAYAILGKAENMLQNSEEAIFYFLKSNENYEAVYQNHGSITALSLLGKTYLSLNDTDTAVKYLQLAQAKAESIKASYEMLDVYDLLHQIYFKQSLFAEAYQALTSYNSIREKVFNISSQVKINEIQTKYELDKLEMKHLQDRELNDYKFNLFSNLTHEFRTPLTLIKAPLELIKEENNLTVVKEKVEYIERNTEHLLKLVNQLLDINKIESGKMPVSFKVGSIAPIIGHVVHLFQEDAEQKEINFTYSLPNSEVQGMFDEDKLEKILFNLLSNALKFTPSNGRIHLHVTAFNEQIVIKVLDNGPGISEENKKLVFEKYYRVNQSGKIAGSGIGLSFVKELVELLGGTIDINSKEQMGTTFTVRIPFANAKNADIVSSEMFEIQDTKIIPISGNVIEKNQNKKPVLLVVEDNADIQKLIAEIFHTDYKVIKAENGSEGLKLARTIVPDMVITDVMMPVMDGFEMCDQIKADNKINHIPIVMLTAKVGIQNRVMGMNMGADAYLAKPFSVAELKSMVENIQLQRVKLRNHYAHNPLFTGSEEMVSADVVFVKSATDEVMKNIENEKYGVEDLASSFNMSRYTLIRKFRAVLNNTPNDFIQKIRLEMAKTMLEKKVASISEIAYKVGFASVTYFSSSFKKEYGMSPRDFMQEKNTD